MHVPNESGPGSRYLSLAPSTTAQFFRFNQELEEPVANVCNMLGQRFPGSQISLTAVYNFARRGLMLVIGISEPLTEETAAAADEIMSGYFQPLMETLGSQERVLVAIGEGLGEHSARYNAPRAEDALAGIEEQLDELGDSGPLGLVLATSIPLFERGMGNDLERVLKSANRGLAISGN